MNTLAMMDQAVNSKTFTHALVLEVLEIGLAARHLDGIKIVDIFCADDVSASCELNVLITMKPLPPRDGAARGQMTMLALNILREAKEPMRTEDINELLMARRGLSAADKPLKRMMLDRLTHHCEIVETGNDSWRLKTRQ